MKHVNIVTNFLELCRENRDWLRKLCVVLIVLILIAVTTLVCYRIHQQNLSVESIEEAPSENIEPETTIESIEIPDPDPTEETSNDIPDLESEPIEVEAEPIEMPSELPSEPEAIESNSAISEDDIELLAIVIYQEVGSDACCDDCRRRVADVILNRVESEYFPNTIYEVLTQRSQYGAFYWTGVVWPERASYSGEAHAVERAYRIAKEVLEGNHSELYGNDYVWQAGFIQGSEGFYCCGVYYGKI